MTVPESNADSAQDLEESVTYSDEITESVNLLESFVNLVKNIEQRFFGYNIWTCLVFFDSSSGLKGLVIGIYI